MLRTIRNYLYYRRILNNNKEQLKNRFNLRIDLLGRLYTVYSINEKTYQSYGDNYIDIELKEYIKNIDIFLKEAGLFELYGLSKKDRINKLQYLIEIRYKPMDVLLVANVLLVIATLILFGISVGLGLVLFLKLL